VEDGEEVSVVTVVTAETVAPGGVYVKSEAESYTLGTFLNRLAASELVYITVAGVEPSIITSVDGPDVTRTPPEIVQAA
jgi:hypothetical protein